MPRDATTPGVDTGTQMEVRVAQAWYWDGFYVRRGIDLQHRFNTDVSTVTDLDILGYTLGPDLTTHTFIGEVKSGRSNSTPKPLDRILWARGLRELVRAEGAEVTTAFRPSVTVREFGRGIGVRIQHVDDVAAREMRLGIDAVSDCGSQGLTVAQAIASIAKQVKSEPELERAFWFLRSEVWFLEPFDALKRTLGLLRQLKQRWPHEQDEQGMRVARWMYAESISVATLQLAKVAGTAISMGLKSFVELATDKLSAGDIPTHNMRNLSDRIDQYIGKLLAATDASFDVKTSAMGAFLPTPPSYLEPLLELIVRLGVSASQTAELPRQIDAVVFERLVRRRNISAVVRDRLKLDSNAERLIRLVGSFLRGQIEVPAPVDRVLMAPILVEAQAEPVTRADSNNDQQTLFK